jgi:asparagine synthase (glutamine-hydrolysing)
MCGILAAIGPGSSRLSEQIFATMTRTLTHRGPDQEGFFRDENVAMGFRRLAILDLSPSGEQPMLDERGEHVLVFNGEIFNYVELREQLMARGHRFRSSGDAEVLLKAYIEWGERCVDRFNGMYAFLIYDKARGIVFGARDRFGTKPLFYAAADDCLIIGSEIKALRASGLVGQSFNEAITSIYLLRGHLDYTNETFFSGIDKVCPSTRFRIDVKKPTPVFARYWNLLDETREPPLRPDEAFRELFEDAVRIRMRSDVPVGVSLSGGLDSTSIICAMARQWDSGKAQPDGKLLAFSFQSDEFDERPYISATLEQTGATQVRTSTNALEFWRELDRVLWFHDEPFNSMTPVVGYRIMQLAAANGVKVILNGQGADEVLGGYPAYFERKRETLIEQRKFRQLVTETREYCEQYGGSVARIVVGEVLKAAKAPVQRLPFYGELASRRRRREVNAQEWFTPEFRRTLPPEQYVPYDAGLARRLFTSTTVTPLPLYLRQEDRNSMAHSVEARLPFLDHRLVTLAFSVAEDWKVKGKLGKVLLREAMKGRIPEIVRTRVDKMGFPTPSTNWFREDLYEPTKDVFSSRAFAELGIFDVKAARALLERHRRAELDASGDLFSMVQFAKWAELAKRRPPCPP